jgi:hypothetical protein
MKNVHLFLLLTGLVACTIPMMVSAQQFPDRVTYTENFDSNSVKFTASSNEWGKDGTFFTSSPYAFLG